MIKSFKELTSKEILSIIQSEGYFPRLESSGEVSFKIQGTTFIFGTCAKGFVYGRLYYNFNHENKWAALLAAQHVELSYIAIKTLVVLDNDSLIFSVESLCNTAETFRTFFNRSLSILNDSVETFADKYQEYKADEDCKNRAFVEDIHMQKCLSDKAYQS